MTLLELFHSDTAAREVLTKIMTERCRLNYRRDWVQRQVRASWSCVDRVTMREIRQLHYMLHPNDAARVPKANLTPRRRQG